jgi:hypothetical protein
MTARPCTPAVKLHGALERGGLRFAVVLAAEVAEDLGRPIELDAALRFLRLVAAQQPEHYYAWALRWLARWSTETNGATNRPGRGAGGPRNRRPVSMQWRPSRDGRLETLIVASPPLVVADGDRQSVTMLSGTSLAA